MRNESRDELLARAYTLPHVCAARGIREGYQGRARAAVTDPDYLKEDMGTVTIFIVSDSSRIGGGQAHINLPQRRVI